MTLLQELRAATAAVNKANKLKCVCPNRGLINLGIEKCTCNKADSVRLAQSQLNTVLNAVRSSNRKETQHG